MNLTDEYNRFRLYAPFRDRAVVCLATGQEDGEKAPFSICQCVSLRVAPAARAANSLFLLPPYGWPAPPEPGLLRLKGAIRIKEGFHGYRHSRNRSG
jgi:hypothetical protein